MRTARAARGALLGSLASCRPVGRRDTGRSRQGAPWRASCFHDVSSSATGRELLRAKAPARGLVSVRLRSRRRLGPRRLRPAAAGSWPARPPSAATSSPRASSAGASGSWCRRAASAAAPASARVSIHFTRIAKTKAGKLLGRRRGHRRRARTRQRLQALGLDLTEHGDANSVEVVLHGRADARTLRAAGFRYRVRVADLAAQARRNAAPRRARTRGHRPVVGPAERPRRPTGACPTTTSR